MSPDFSVRFRVFRATHVAKFCFLHKFPALLDEAISDKEFGEQSRKDAERKATAGNRSDLEPPPRLCGSARESPPPISKMFIPDNSTLFEFAWVAANRRTGVLFRLSHRKDSPDRIDARSLQGSLKTERAAKQALRLVGFLVGLSPPCSLLR